MNRERDGTTPTIDVVPDGVPGRTKAERVRAMFARIVPRYDLMNALMTGGMDRRWRNEAASAASPRGGLALDVGAGTGDLTFALVRAGATRVVGVDFCEEMLAVARTKARAQVPDGTTSFLAADALNLPFLDCSFDCVASGFLLRNVANLRAGLFEMARVLKPGGRLVCLELTHPPSPIAPVVGLYVRNVVPLVGTVVTGEAAAYRYLPASLGPFPDARRLAALLVEAGLANVQYRRLGLGTVALHVGTRMKRAVA